MATGFRRVMKILVLTVGGSSEPLVNSIRQNRPDMLAFLCSDDAGRTKGSYTQVVGEGLVCEKGTKPNILVQTGVSDAGFPVVRIREFDDPNACYVESLDLLAELRRRYPEAQIIADYTGGTKSMSSGLVLAALDTEGVVLGVQQGVRADLDKVVSGTQFTRLTCGRAPLVNRQCKRVAEFLRRFDYPAAASLLEDVLAQSDLPHSMAEPLRYQLALARGLNAWDRFDHATAWTLLSPLRSRHVDLLKFLQAVVSSRRRLDPEFERQAGSVIRVAARGHGYELVEDLLLNAERRASQGRYDDAVARLYRALEMLAQARLRLAYGIDTSALQTIDLPVDIRPIYNSRQEGPGGTTQLALKDAYELLALLATVGPEPVGNAYVEKRGHLLDFLAVRNRSLYAHGFTPVTEAQYRKAESLVVDFCRECVQAILASGEVRRPYAGPVQFPREAVYSAENERPWPVGPGHPQAYSGEAQDS